MFFGVDLAHRAVAMSRANVEALPEQRVQPAPGLTTRCGISSVWEIRKLTQLSATVGELHCNRTWQLPCHVCEYDHWSLVTAE